MRLLREESDEFAQSPEPDGQGEKEDEQVDDAANADSADGNSADVDSDDADGDVTGGAPLVIEVSM